jgi:hypothetical protein
VQFARRGEKGTGRRKILDWGRERLYMLIGGGGGRGDGGI